jgi:enoyl-CoA hydratase/carnithine racemase
MTDLEADPAVKVVVFQSANPDFFIAHLPVRRRVVRRSVVSVTVYFELNFGRYLPALGRANEDDTDTQPD